MDNEFKSKAKKSMEKYVTRPDEEVWGERVEALKKAAARIPSVLGGQPAVDKTAPIGIPMEDVRIEERLRNTSGDLRKLREQLSKDPSQGSLLEQDYESYRQRQPSLDLEAREEALRQILNKYSMPRK